MKKILITGVSVIDFIFQIDAIPNNYEKYRANDASISGGGVAAFFFRKKHRSAT